MPDHAERVRFVADRGDARLRLDQILVRRIRSVSRLSRSLAQRWIESGAVTVNGSPAVRASARPGEGASVEVRLPLSAPRRTRPAAEHGRLAVIYEDDEVLVIDKPPGMVVHPSYKQAAGTLLNAVLGRLSDRRPAGEGAATPGIVTRLDKDTSGLVIVALNPAAHAALQRDSTAGRVSKEYLAVVTGRPRPPAGRILLALARDPGDRRRVIAAGDGAPSETAYELMSSSASADGPALSLVRCSLVTGRTHQIRVHLAARGWPVLGDRFYGGPSDAIPRQALHAWRVSFPHPVTRDPIRAVAPLPPDIERVLHASGLRIPGLPR